MAYIFTPIKIAPFRYCKNIPLFFNPPPVGIEMQAFGGYAIATLMMTANDICESELILILCRCATPTQRPAAMPRLPSRSTTRTTRGAPRHIQVKVQLVINNSKQNFYLYFDQYEELLTLTLRRRAEIELNYSRDLEKLSKLVTSRHKEQKTKRELWSSLSSTEIWRQLVAETRKAGR